MLAMHDANRRSADQWDWTFYRFDSNCNAGQPGLPRVRRDRQPTVGDPFPLPGTLALFGIGLAGLGLARRKS